MNRLGPRPVPLATRFWKLVDTSSPDGCWPWLGAREPRGYGRVTVGSVYDGDRRIEGAHRVAYLLTYGAIPKGESVLHHCDNPPCVRPAHLYNGTAKDNARDWMERGKGNRGENHSRARLTETEVCAIRRRYSAGGVTQKNLAMEYGVTRENITAIINRRTWKDTP